MAVSLVIRERMAEVVLRARVPDGAPTDLTGAVLSTVTVIAVEVA